MPLRHIAYTIGPYNGTVSVEVEDDEDDDVVIAKAKRKVMRLWGPMILGPYYESWKVVRP